MVLKILCGGLMKERKWISKLRTIQIKGEQEEAEMISTKHQHQVEKERRDGKRHEKTIRQFATGRWSSKKKGVVRDTHPISRTN